MSVISASRNLEIASSANKGELHFFDHRPGRSLSLSPWPTNKVQYSTLMLEYLDNLSTYYRVRSMKGEILTTSKERELRTKMA